MQTPQQNQSVREYVLLMGICAFLLAYFSGLVRADPAVWVVAKSTVALVLTVGGGLLLLEILAIPATKSETAAIHQDDQDKGQTVDFRLEADDSTEQEGVENLVAAD